MKAITRCVGWHLDRRGWPTWNAESSHLALDREVTALDSLLSHSITYRIALGPRAGEALPGPRQRLLPARRRCGRCRRPQESGAAVPLHRPAGHRHRFMTCAQRLERVFGIEIETCEQCGAR